MGRTILLGLDGCTFTVVDPLIKDGVMPFLKRFTENGFRSVLMSTPNPLTPPAWTTLATGRTPGNHGVFDFIRAQEHDGEVFFTLYDTRDIKCETIWSIVSRKGKTVTLLNFPVTFPPRPISGYLVPGLTSWRHMRRGVYPSDLYDDLKTIPNFNPKELAWDFELEKKAAREMPESEVEEWVNIHIRREEQWFNIARHMMKTSPTDLTAVVFDGADKLQHICWRYLDPAHIPTTPTAHEQAILDLCREYFRRLDGYLAELVELAGPDAGVFMASDHGFTTTNDVFRLNSWLADEGYLKWPDASTLETTDEKILERRRNSNFVMCDWSGTTAYCRTSSSNGIYIRVANTPGQQGIQPSEYNAFRARLIEKLMSVTDPETGEKIVSKVMTREDVFSGTAMMEAPDLTLVLRDHGFVSIAEKQPLMKKRAEPTGTHHPEGVFFAGGPGIRKNIHGKAMSIADVPAALLYSLGLGIPEDFEGCLPTEVFEPDLLQSRPQKVDEPTVPPDSFEREMGTKKEEEEAEAAVLERLKALGYME